MKKGLFQSFNYKPVYTRWIIELAFCIAAYFILLKMFVSSSRAGMIDHLYTSIFLGTLILASTVNSWVIRKHFLKPRTFWIFLLLFAANALLWTWFNHVLFDRLIDYILPEYYFISYYEFLDLFKFFLVFVSSVTLLDLAWEWFHLQETRYRLVVVEKEKIDAELKALTNQVNPHFLFNSLTVLYSLALKNSQETASAIIKLSDTLRYVIYEAGRDEVPLRQEVELIRNYIDLQRYRIPDSAAVNFDTEVSNGSLPIVPMLFLPLVENSFKHGVTTEISNTFVDIRLRTKGDTIFFVVRNSKNQQAKSRDSGGGIGLKNIEGRLKLLYPGRFDLSVQESADVFEVNLNLQVT